MRVSTCRSIAGRRPNPALRSKLGLPENKKVVTSVARLAAGNGQAELIEAAARVIQEFPEAAFFIVGEESPPNGPITSCLHSSVLRLGLSDHVVFAGARGDVPDILAITDVFVHCPQLGSKAWEFAISRQWLRESHL